MNVSPAAVTADERRLPSLTARVTPDVFFFFPITQTGGGSRSGMEVLKMRHGPISVASVAMVHVRSAATPTNATLRLSLQWGHSVSFAPQHFDTGTGWENLAEHPSIAAVYDGIWGLLYHGSFYRQESNISTDRSGIGRLHLSHYFAKAMTFPVSWKTRAINHFLFALYYNTDIVCVVGSGGRRGIKHLQPVPAGTLSCCLNPEKLVPFIFIQEF